MAGNSPARAVRAFLSPIQAALSCFATGKVTVDTYQPEVEGVLALNAGGSARLNGPERLELSMTMRYVVRETGTEGRWKVATTGWIYELLAHDGRSLAAYHWHPISSSHVTAPHLHVLTAAKRHFPTGRVLVEDVLSLAQEFGAEPVDAAKWTRREAANRLGFRRSASWGQLPPLELASPV